MTNITQIPLSMDDPARVHMLLELLTAAAVRGPSAATLGTLYGEVKTCADAMGIVLPPPTKE